MDFGNAFMLGLGVFVLTEFFKKLAPKWAADPRIIVAAILVISQIVVWGVRYSVWGPEQVVGNHPLDQLNFGSIVIVGVFLAAIAVGINTVKAIGMNIGQNQPTNVTAVPSAPKDQ